jgi:hypothetical protein
MIPDVDLNKLKAENARLREALSEVFDMIEKGILRRYITEKDDHNSIKDAIKRLEKAHDALKGKE